MHDKPLQENLCYVLTVPPWRYLCTLYFFAHFMLYIYAELKT